MAAFALVADDNRICREVAAHMLEQLGCAVDRASDGADAMRMAAEKQYDAIFMDVRMPGIDGLEAAQWIHLIRPDVPVFAITASIEEETRTQCALAGMNGYLTKPVSKADFAELLDLAVSVNAFSVTASAGK